MAENEKDQCLWTDLLEWWISLSRFFGPDRRSSIALFNHLENVKATNNSSSKNIENKKDSTTTTKLKSSDSKNNNNSLNKSKSDSKNNNNKNSNDDNIPSAHDTLDEELRSMIKRLKEEDIKRQSKYFN